MVNDLIGINEQVKKIVTNYNVKYKIITNTHYKIMVFEVIDLAGAILTMKGFQ